MLHSMNAILSLICLAGSLNSTNLEPDIRGWAKSAGSAAKVILDNGRTVLFDKALVVYAPDGTTCGTAEIQPGEPLCITLNSTGKATKVIRWNLSGVVEGKVDLGLRRDSRWESSGNSTILLGSERFADYITCWLKGSKETAASHAVLNPAKFDAVSFDYVAHFKSFDASKPATLRSSLSILKGPDVLWSAPVTQGKSSAEVEISDLDSFELRADAVNAGQGVNHIYVAKWSFRRYAWRTPKPLSPAPGQKARAVTLSWSAATGSDDYLVEVQRTGGNPIADPQTGFILRVTKDTTFDTQGLPIGSYRWRVSSLKSGAIWGFPADWRTFIKDPN